MRLANMPKRLAMLLLKEEIIVRPSSGPERWRDCPTCYRGHEFGSDCLRDQSEFPVGVIDAFGHLCGNLPGRSGTYVRDEGRNDGAGLPHIAGGGRIHARRSQFRSEMAPRVGLEPTT